ncbi:MAG: hypothetical protein WBA46_06925 [Thermomicrobiales bacterium]
MESWHDFLIAMAGASGVLVGLLFVAISLNIDQLLTERHLLSRAAACLELLTTVLAFSCALLIPDVNDTVRSWMILVGGLLAWAIVGIPGFREIGQGGAAQRSRGIVALVLFQLATVPLVVAGFASFRMGTDALYILAPTFIVALIVVVLDSWVLLVEVRR